MRLFWRRVRGLRLVLGGGEMTRPKWVVGSRAMARVVGSTALRTRTLIRIGHLRVEKVVPGGRQIRARMEDVLAAKAYNELWETEHLSGPEYGQIVGAPKIGRYLGISEGDANRLAESGELPSTRATTKPYVLRASIVDLDAINRGDPAPGTPLPTKLRRSGVRNERLAESIPGRDEIFGATRYLLLMDRARAWQREAEIDGRAPSADELAEMGRYGIEVPA